VVFTGCLLLFLASMTLVTVSQHIGLLWVAVEATTLASAPLIYFHRQTRSLEATWKYLLVCSVGIALALLGNFFLAIAASATGDSRLPLTVTELISRAGTLQPVWLKAAFLLFLVGYGTKMGLVPLHTWLPDAHSESPSVVSALLSGALLNCAFLSILRLHSVLEAAGLGSFSGGLLRGFGLLSVGAAAAFLIRQADYKRLLAYSSVEHMGLLALGAGLGGIGGFASLLHACNHTLSKGMLFLAAGNILMLTGSKNADRSTGLLRRLPFTGMLWIAGLLAITGTPPFGTFVSKLLLVKRALETQRYWIAGAGLFALAAAFAGMSSAMLRMAYGRPAGFEADGLPAGEGRSPQVRERQAAAAREPLWSVLPPLALGLLALVLGLYLPPPLAGLMNRAAAQLGVGP
jgi:hydrogenase-4 component F